MDGRNHHFTFPIRIKFLFVVNFQPFELIEPNEPLEQIELYLRVENIQPHKPLKLLKPPKPLPTSSPTSSPQLNDER